MAEIAICLAAKPLSKICGMEPGRRQMYTLGQPSLKLKAFNFKHVAATHLQAPIAFVARQCRYACAQRRASLCIWLSLPVARSGAAAARPNRPRLPPRSASRLRGAASPLRCRRCCASACWRSARHGSRRAAVLFLQFVLQFIFRRGAAGGGCGAGLRHGLSLVRCSCQAPFINLQCSSPAGCSWCRSARPLRRQYGRRAGTVQRWHRCVPLWQLSFIYQMQCCETMASNSQQVGSAAKGRSMQRLRSKEAS